MLLFDHVKSDQFLIKPVIIKSDKNDFKIPRIHIKYKRLSCAVDYTATRKRQQAMSMKSDNVSRAVIDPLF